jgi:hypothetical protein
MLVLLFVWILNLLPVRSQDTTPPAAGAAVSVSLSAAVEPKVVPLNRNLILRIEVCWEGDLDRIGIGQVTEPVLANLEIIGSGASNRVVALASGQRAIKEVVYTLRPKSLGMAYIEPVTLSYEDRSTQKVDNLKTQRLAVEIAVAVPDEKGHIGAWLLWVGGGVALLLTAAGLAWGQVRRKKRTQVAAEPATSPEECFLAELRSEGGSQPASTAEGFARLSRLLRRYLAAKYGLRALEETTPELIAELPGIGLDEDLVPRCESLLNMADAVKFSRQEAPPSEFELAYTTVETLLERNLAQVLREIQEARGKQAADRKRNKSRQPS